MYIYVYEHHQSGIGAHISEETMVLMNTHYDVVGEIDLLIVCVTYVTSVSGVSTLITIWSAKSAFEFLEKVNSIEYCAVNFTAS